MTEQTQTPKAKKAESKMPMLEADSSNATVFAAFPRDWYSVRLENGATDPYGLDKTKKGTDTVTEGYAVGINENGEREWRVASNYLLGEAVLNIPIDRQNNATTKHLADVMRTLGWGSGKTIRVGKLPCRGYTKTITGKTIAEVKPIVEPVAVVEPEGPRLVVRDPPMLIRRLIR